MDPPAYPLCAFDEPLRVRLAASPETPPETLGALAHDPAPTVRAAVALNPASPAAADHHLSRDADVRVRMLIGRRLASMLPMLDPAERDQAGNRVLETLAALVEDEAERVRCAIADVVKDMPEAPRALILTLARDTAIAVCEPVIRLSPVLTQDDLLALLADPPCPDAVTAIARRPGLSEKLADAVAATAGNAAIRLLLANESAAIREATLDSLVARAAAQINWHEPLVHRPKLSRDAVRALAGIVSTHLLDVLANRADLDPALVAELRLRLAARLAPKRPTPQPATAEAEVMVRARRMRDAGTLTEAELAQAIRRGEMRLGAAMLAVAASVPLEPVDRAVRLRSAKALLALAWKAGFSMRVCGPLQTALAGIAPAAALRPAPCNAFPLSPEEMQWQLDMLLRPQRGGETLPASLAGA